MPIEFPIVHLLWSQSSYAWLVAYVHVEGQGCPRCEVCDKTYNVYSGTVFAGRQLTPEQVLVLVRGRDGTNIV